MPAGAALPGSWADMRHAFLPRHLLGRARTHHARGPTAIRFTLTQLHCSTELRFMLARHSTRRQRLPSIWIEFTQPNPSAITRSPAAAQAKPRPRAKENTDAP